MSFSIIIVTHNSEDVIAECINSVLEADNESTSIQVIIVDNHSIDNTCNIAKKYVGDNVRISLIENSNVGFGAGVNRGVQAANGDIFLILNPDVRLQRGFFNSIQEHFDEYHDIGILAPKLLNPDGSVQTSIRRWPSIFALIGNRIPVLQLVPFIRLHVDRYLMKDYQHDGLLPVQFALGACLAIRAETFREIGGFRQDFFLYFEDSQLCKDAWDAGHSVIYTPYVKAIHEHKRQSLKILSAPFRHHLRSAIRFYKLNPALKWRLPLDENSSIRKIPESECNLTNL